LYEKKEGVARVTINKPEKLNAISSRTMQEMTVALRDAGNDKTVGVVVITASNEEGIEEEAKSFGLLDYLKKPLDIFEIDRIASHVLS